jgi:hypothetical protein
VATFTIQKLIDRAMTAADMHDDFVLPAQWLEWVNVERDYLEQFIAQAGYVLAETVVSVTADGSASYTISPEPLAVLAVYEEVEGRYRRLRSDDIFDGQAGRFTADSGQARKFRIKQGTNQVELHLYPKPSSGTYKVITIAAPTEVTTVADTVSYPLSWEEHIVLGLARRALAKEETVNPTLSTDQGKIESHIEETAWNRMYASSGARVRNVDRVERQWFDALEVPTRDYWVYV